MLPAQGWAPYLAQRWNCAPPAPSPPTPAPKTLCRAAPRSLPDPAQFKNTRGRQRAYEALLEACEAPLEAAIAAALEVQSERSFGQLERTLTEVGRRRPLSARSVWLSVPCRLHAGVATADRASGPPGAAATARPSRRRHATMTPLPRLTPLPRAAATRRCHAPPSRAAATRPSRPLPHDARLTPLRPVRTPPRQALSEVAQEERREAGERERLQKLAERRERKQLAALRRAEAEAAAAAAAVAAALKAEEETRPLSARIEAGMRSALETAVSSTLNSVVHALDPSQAAAEAAAKAAKAAEEAAAAEAAAARQAEARRIKRRMKKLAPPAEEFSVRLVRGLGPPSGDADGGGSEGGGGGEDGGGDAGSPTPPPPPTLPRERSRLVGSTILVDATHPDFQARWRQTRQGAPKVDERLCGYLATIVSGAYRERAYQSASRQRVDYAQAYEEMISTYCRLEDKLRAVLPALLKEMEAQAASAEETP